MLFDPVARKSLLGSCNCIQSSTSSSSAEISALSAVSTLFSSVASFMHPADHALPLPSTPGPNICNKLASPSINASPAIYNTPSKLEWFLQAVERNGVPGVETFHPMLSAKGYGPDIMHLINICDLEKIGMPLGDAIHLKKYAARWWSVSRTCTSVHDRPPRVKEVQGIALTSPVRPSEGTGQIRPPRTTRTKTLDKHLPIQDKPGWKPDTRSHSQVTHVI